MAVDFQDESTAALQRLERLKRMTDGELIREGNAAAAMAQGSPREIWKVQLEECRSEWRRRKSWPT